MNPKGAWAPDSGLYSNIFVNTQYIVSSQFTIYILTLESNESVNISVICMTFTFANSDKNSEDAEDHLGSFVKQKCDTT